MLSGLAELLYHWNVATPHWLGYVFQRPESHCLTPERYAQLAGPYNRRNIYGAALAYGPLLSTNPRTRPMFAAVAGYALCGEAPVLKELGVDPTTVAGQLRIRLELLSGTSIGSLPQIPRMLEVPCS